MNLSRFFMRLNGPIAWILRSPLHALLDPALMLVTVTGRKTGKRFTIPVGYQRDGDTIVVLVSRARTKNWWRNFRERGPIQVHTRGALHDAMAELVPPEKPEFLEAFEKTFTQMPWLAPQFGVRFSRGDKLTEQQRAVLAEEARVIRIDLDRTAAASR